MASTDREHIRRRREAENRLRREREEREKRGRMLKAVGVFLGALVAIGGIVTLVVFGPQWFGPKLPEFAPSGTVSITSSDGAQHDVPIAAADGGAAIQVGQPDAPVTIDYWYDFSCPHCIEYQKATSQTMHDLIASGQAKVSYRTIHIVAPYGLEAGAALLGAVQHQPESFFAVHDGLMLVPAQTQQAWTAADYADAMGQFGVTDEAALADIRAGLYRPVIEQFTSKATDKDGVHGTPAVAINGQMQDPLPDPAGLIARVGEAGGDVTAIPTGAAAPAAGANG